MAAVAGPSRAKRWLLGLALLAGALLACTYVVVALARMRYPFELEWMEGGVLDHVRRVLDGKPLYAPPSLDFVSFLYPPFYFWVAALVARLAGGLDFFPLRLMAFVCSLGTCVLLAVLVRWELVRGAAPEASGTREAGVAPWLAGALAACLYAASFRSCDAWFDLARCDSLFVLLLLGALALLRSCEGVASAAVAGLLLVAAFLTKQAAVVIAFPIAVLALATRRRRGLVFAVVGFGGVAASVAWLQHDSHGWFAYYCATLPAHHPLLKSRELYFVEHDLVRRLGPSVLLAALAIAARVRRRGAWTGLVHLAVLGGALASAASVRAEVGAERNNIMPLAAVLAWLAPLALDERTWARLPRPAARLAPLGVPLLLLAQFAASAYDPRGQLPTPADRAAGEALSARLAAIPGTLWISHHGYLATRSGRPAFAHALALDNVFMDDPGPWRAELERQIVAALRAHRFAAVVHESNRHYGNWIEPEYAVAETLFADPQVFYPVTGAHLRPQYLYLPRPAR